jgi:hypothetical protein
MVSVSGVVVDGAQWVAPTRYLYTTQRLRKTQHAGSGCARTRLMGACGTSTGSEPGRGLACCRERVWRRYVEDELWNRDNPLARTRTQRRHKRSKEGGEGEEGMAGGRRPRPPLLEQPAGLDRAYQREYLEAAEAKRQRHETAGHTG